MFRRRYFVVFLVKVHCSLFQCFRAVKRGSRSIEQCKMGCLSVHGKFAVNPQHSSNRIRSEIYIATRWGGERPVLVTELVPWCRESCCKLRKGKCNAFLNGQIQNRYKTLYSLIHSALYLSLRNVNSKIRNTLNGIQRWIRMYPTLHL